MRNLGKNSRRRVAALGATAVAAVAFVPLAAPGSTAGAQWVNAAAEIGARLDVDFGTTSNPTTEVHVLGINDFHGHLETATPGNLYGAAAGGSVYLAGQLRSLQTTYGTRVATVHAGDAIGATPLVSGGFLDEPSVLSLRRMQVDFAAVGNHEFDKGKAELVRHQNGGCHPVQGCQYGGTNTTYPDGSAVYPGAGGASTGGLEPFKFLSDNVIDTSTGNALFPWTIAEHTITFPNTANTGQVKVGFIGETLEATPTVVTPTGVAGLSFLDEADRANALVPQFQAEGVNALVLVVHQGGFQNPAASNVNNCFGALVDGNGNPYDVLEVARRLDPAIKVIVSGHTHAEYNCIVERDGVADADTSDDLLITSASSFGRAISDITLTIDDVTGQLVAASATNARVNRVAPLDDDSNPATFDQASIVGQYANSIAPIASRVIGEITGAMPNTGVSLPGTGGPGQPASIPAEQPAGDLIADAQLAATSGAPNSAVIALMNPGGVRNPGFTFTDNLVTYGEAFTVQPFGNSLVTLTLTGAQLKDVLEQQFSGCLGQTVTRILQPSATFGYQVLADPDGSLTVNPADCGQRIYNMKINGAAVQPSSSYRVTINNFLSTGGDGFTKFLQGTDLVGGAQDIDALEQYLLPSLGVGADIAPPATTRITAFSGPVPEVPEAPIALLLSLSSAVVLGGGLWLVQRRRAATSAA